MLPELLISKLRVLYLHSRRRYLINSIPLLSIVALLVVMGLSIMPNLFNTYAVYAAMETFGDSFASLTLDTATVTVPVAPGGSGYLSKEITVTTNNIESYALTINAPKVLNRENDATSQATSWGYAYGQSGNLEDMDYTNFTGSTQELESGNVSINTTKVLALNADFSDTVTAGHYTAEIELALIATPKTAITYTLGYDANGGNASTVPAPQNCEAYDNAPCSIAIPNTTPTRGGYEFLGWAETSGAATGQYAPGGNIEISSDKTLYGVWRATGTKWSTGVSSGTTTMQGVDQVSGGFCSKVNTPTKGATSVPTITLQDSRSSSDNTYTIAKLYDGKCWMTQNLRLVNTAISSADSDVSSYTIPRSATWSDTSSSANRAYYDSGTRTAYYSWYTATAGSAVSSGIAPSSICPRGWKLPTGGSGGDFETLYSAAGSPSVSTFRGAPYNFSNIGYMDFGSVNYKNEMGAWWSRTAQDSNTANNLLIMDNVGTSDSSVRYSGFAVRCVSTY